VSHAEKALARAYIRLLGFDPVDVHSVVITPTRLVVERLMRDEDGRLVIIDGEVTERICLDWDGP
jgi:hypothetical protein